MLRSTSRRMVRMVRILGPVSVYAQKTHIVFMVRVRFAGVVVRNRWLDVGLWLTRAVDDPRVMRVEHLGPRTHYTHFRLASVEDLDEDHLELLAETYQIGKQQLLPKR